MAPRPLIWTGQHYSISVKRRWTAFWAYVPVLYIHVQNMEFQPRSISALQIDEAYDLVMRAKPLFRRADDWWLCSTHVCDQFCEAFILGAPADDNVFMRYPGHYGALDWPILQFIKSARGGPAQISLRDLEAHSAIY